MREESPKQDSTGGLKPRPYGTPRFPQQAITSELLCSLLASAASKHHQERPEAKGAVISGKEGDGRENLKENDSAVPRSEARQAGADLHQAVSTGT